MFSEDEHAHAAKGRCLKEADTSVVDDAPSAASESARPNMKSSELPKKEGDRGGRLPHRKEGFN